MSEHILSILRKKLSDESLSGLADPETKRNALKEELQYYVLNFIYHHPQYDNWIMYGGSALRICHDLDRMSVDLDFEIANDITPAFLETLKQELEQHFTSTYGVDKSFVTVKVTSGRGLLLKFHVGKALSFGAASDQVHVKIDLNYFSAPKTVVERIPVNHNQLSFVIVTYTMSSLMASKLAAIFLRGTRGVGKDLYQEKGRDIYDLLWYMGKKIVPDLDYLQAKDVKISDPRALFDKLTIQMNNVSDTNLKQDLLPLFTNRMYIENWLANWRESYMKLVDEYKIYTVTTLQGVLIDEDFHTDNFTFTYRYNTVEGGVVTVRYLIVYEWVTNQKTLDITVDKNVIKSTTFRLSKEPSEQLEQLATLFHKKTETYLTKMNRFVVGNSIITKLIRTSTDMLNRKEEVVLNKSALLSCELDDLLK